MSLWLQGEMLVTPPKNRVLCDRKRHWLNQAERHRGCPKCRLGALAAEEPQVPVGEDPDTIIVPDPRPVALNPTQPVLVLPNGRQPAVAWLVAVKGPEQGLDFRIEGGSNTIGHGKAYAVALSGGKSGQTWPASTTTCSRPASGSRRGAPVRGPRA